MAAATAPDSAPSVRVDLDKANKTHYAEVAKSYEHSWFYDTKHSDY